MQIWIHDSKMRKIVALNNDIPDMLSYTNSAWHPYLDQATSTFDFTIPKFLNGKLHEDIKLINDECFVSFYVNDSYQVFYIATLQEDDFNIQLTCNNTNLEYALEYANPFSSESAQTIEWYLNHMDLLSFAAVEIGFNEISDRKRTLTFDSQETKMNRLQSLMSKFEAEFEFKVELNRDGTYKRIVINIYQKNGIGTDRKDVVLYYSNGLKGVQVSSDKTQMFNAGVFDGKNGVNLANVEFSEKNADGVEEFYSRKGDIFVYAPLSMQRYPATMRPDGQDNWIRKDFQTEYENVNDLKAYALRTLKQYAYPLVTYTASVQSGFVSQHTDLKLGDTIRIIDNNFAGGLALEARVSEMIISFDNPANNSFIFTNYRKIDNKPSAALQTRIEQAVESKLPYRIELATTGGVTFKNNEGETIVKPSLYKGNLPYTKDVSWHWALEGVTTVGTQYRIQARDITDSEVLTVAAHVGNLEVATTEITLTNVNDGKKSSYYSDTFPEDNPKGTLEKGDSLFLTDGDTVKQYYWNGTEWVINPIVSDVEALKEQIAEDLKDVPNREEFENKIAEELANSKAEIETQIETAKTQAESNAKEYADTINQETAKVAELANAAAGEIKADLVNVKNNLTSTSIVANNAQAAADEAKQDLAEVASDLSTAKQDLANSVTAVNTKVDSTKEELTQAKQDLVSQAQQLQTQANAQTELTKRVTTVETTANGTKTTVNELTKTVSQNGKDITSVTNRTKTVEDDLASTKTTLTQVQTTANSASQKTATLETGLNGLNARFDSLRVGTVNLLKNTKSFTGSNITGSSTILNETYQDCAIRYLKNTNPNSNFKDIAQFSNVVNPKVNSTYTISFWAKGSGTVSTFFHGPQYYLQVVSGYTSQERTTISGDGNVKFDLSDDWQRYWVVYKLKNAYPTSDTTVSKHLLFRQYNSSIEEEVWLTGCKLEEGNVATDYSPNDADIESKVAEYKQTADQNYASLQSTVQNLDGTVQANKTTAEQTAAGFKTRIESLETYKNGESERANAYFESAKTETAKQLTAERTAIANNYVAKSTYTSDVTGIRNELSATTSTANATKTNLANYQASNDKMVASLRSSLQTTDGNVSNLQTKVEAVPGQITSAVSAVEGKIPKSLGGRNLIIRSQIQNGYIDANGNLVKTNDQFTTGFIDATNNKQFTITAPEFSNGFSNFRLVKYSADKNFLGRDIIPYNQNTKTIKTINLADNVTYFKISFDGVYDEPFKIERGSLSTDWSPAPEDDIEEISSLSSQIKQTADGMTLLATKTELNTAKTDLQSGISTATSKANNAQATANSNAQTISTHTTQISALNTGLSAKVSKTDFNMLSGRVTTAENNIIAKANELSSKITSVEGKIPTEIGAKNLIINSTAKEGVRLSADGGEWQDQWHSLSDWIKIEPNTTYTLTTYEDVPEENMWYSMAWYSTNNANYSGFISRPTGAVTAANLKGGKQYQAPTNAKYAKVSYPTKYAKFKLERGKISTDYTPAPEDYDSKLSTVQSEFKQTTDSIKASVQSLDNNTVKSSSLTINTDGVVIKAGKSTSDFANAVGSYFSVNQNAINLFSDKINVKGSMIVSGAITSDKIASKQINTAHLNGKIITADVISSNAVTADAIKAGAVTTDKMSANSINGDRITAGTLDAAKIKAGSISASQIASGTLTSEQIKSGAIKSINIEASAITSDKIASNSIDASKIVTNGLTANIIKGGVLQSLNGSTNFELDTGKLFYNNNNTGVFRVQNGASTMGLKFSNTPVTVSGTSRILSRVILGGDRNETSLDDGKWDKGGFSGLIIETIKGAIPAVNEHADSLRAVSDTIYFTHTYSADSPTGVSAHGWKMETYAPDSSYSGNIVLKPYGLNYRQSDIIVGDIRLDNGDGSGYWMRATINTLKACFGHIINGGVSENALNAIRSELNKISGT